MGVLLLLAEVCMQLLNETIDETQFAVQPAFKEPDMMVIGNDGTPHWTVEGKVMLNDPPIGMASALVIEN